MVGPEGALLLALLGLPLSGGSQTANLLPNPSFELVEPPAPTAQCLDPTAASAELWRPRTWDTWAEGGAALTLPDDPAQARTGRRGVHVVAATGLGRLRYQALPVPGPQTWTVTAWARGHGKLRVDAWDVTADPWKPAESRVFELTAAWAEVRCEFAPPESCRKWLLDLITEGPTEAWIDDVQVTCPGLQPLGLPPEGPLARDEHTLLHLPFEEPLNEDAFFVRPQAALTGPDEGRFGRALRLGAGGYVACSANEGLNPQRGTIEVWCKLLSPGGDGIAHGIVTVPGPEGLWLGKDQYSHIHFGFSSGWGRLSGTTAMGYAWNWEAGVWRHFAACWDSELLQLFVDGKLIGWERNPKLSRFLGPELGIGSPGMELDDLRVSDIVRYRQGVPPDD
ncbi:MAG: LamG domain-containing protein [Armatimonadetes bacterium]|nr:LamG domain-containing protein [Armatimonadota bacterium]